MLIGICGGIGSGKSVVSRILRSSGYLVYDCDLEARRLMETSPDIKRRIHDEISSDVTDGESMPDRHRLAELVFADEESRLRLNGIMHAAVRRDLQYAAASCHRNIMFVEAAILAESGLAPLCDAIWLVSAPADVRLQRAMDRDRCSERQILSRMHSQLKEESMLREYSNKTTIIHNDGIRPLLPQIEVALGCLDNPI